MRKYAHLGDNIVELHKLGEGRGIDCGMETSILCIRSSYYFRVIKLKRLC